jgi:hypothetical protein
MLVRKFFLTSMIFLPSFLTVHGQSIQNITIPTNFLGAQINNFLPKYGGNLKLLNDSTAELQSFVEGDSNNLVKQTSVLEIDIKGFNSFLKTTVWLRDTATLPSNQFGEFGFAQLKIVDQLNSNSLYYEVLILPGDTISEVQFYTVQNNYIKDSLLFTLQFNGDLISADPFFYDDEIYILSYNDRNSFGYVRKYDIGGALLLERIIDPNNFDISTDFGVNLYHNLRISPLSDSIIILDAPNQYFLLGFKRFNLETVFRIGINNTIVANIANNNNYRGARTLRYKVDSLGVELDGTAGTDFGGVRKFQYFNCRVAWDSTLISYKHYGDSTIDEAMFGLAEVNGVKYIAGYSDYSTNYFFSQTFRSIPILRVDSIGITDSIVLFGQKNNRPVDLISDHQGNLILASYFSNAWSDDSIFLQLTKIPIGILTSIREQKLSRNVAIYPNPTRDFINSNEFENGDVVQVFNQQGQLLKEERISFSNGIDVRFLRTGTYFFQLIRENERQTVLFIKTD